MAESDKSGDIQFGALPYRVGTHGVEILLITTRETQRWIKPRGWPMIGKKPHRVAEIEAFQEAGVKGIVKKKPIGAFPYSKIMPDGSAKLCLVQVFPLQVKLEKVKWREHKERVRAWFRAEDAAAAVEAGGLAQIIVEWA
jgi:hypothetical protein